MILRLPNTLKSSCVLCVLFPLKIFMWTFFKKNIHIRVNLRSYKIRKIPSLVEFHSLYQLLP